jgi:hypothetical protein
MKHKMREQQRVDFLPPPPPAAIFFKKFDAIIDRFDEEDYDKFDDKYNEYDDKYDEYDDGYNDKDACTTRGGFPPTPPPAPGEHGS